MCKMMDMPCLSTSAYTSNQRSFATGVQQSTDEILRRAAKIVRDVYRQKDPANIIGEHDIIDLKVSFFGVFPVSLHPLFSHLILQVALVHLNIL
jgi:hypothetical protein